MASRTGGYRGGVDELARAVVQAFRARGRTLATAESLTGGLLGATITAVPGASTVYRGGLITYATDLKGTLGGVPHDVLARDGAVSEATVRALARTTASSCRADIGIALSGVAGPDPQEGHSAGTVWLGWSTSGGQDAELLALDASRGRDGVRDQAVEAALRCLVRLVGADAARCCDGPRL